MSFKDLFHGFDPRTDLRPSDGAPVRRAGPRVQARRAEPSRRLVLRSALSSLALPFLASALPRSAWAATSAAPKRLLFFYAPCGIQMSEFTPDKAGANYDLKQITAPLGGTARYGSVQSDVSVISGLWQNGGFDARAGDHARGTGCFLTDTLVKFTAGADIQNAISVDQVAAGAIGGETLLPSLQLGTEGGGATGDCDSGYSCAYMRNISWTGPTTPLPCITDPQIAFNRLFAGVDTSLTEAEQARRTALRTSVLDHVLDQVNTLSARVSPTDKAKLDEYTTGVRDLEVRIAALDSQVCIPGEEPPLDWDFPLQVELLSDLMALAFECDMTRLITFMLNNGGTGRSYPFIGVPRSHHEISHHNDDPANLADLYTIESWEVEQFGYLVSKLKGITDADGSRAIDNTLMLFSSEIQDGNTHFHGDMPVLLAGAGGGIHTPGRHLQYNNEEPISDLFISMLESVGVTVGTFGQFGTGPLGGLV